MSFFIIWIDFLKEFNFNNCTDFVVFLKFLIFIDDVNINKNRWEILNHILEKIKKIKMIKET